MEGLILLGLAGFGYVINKDKQKHRVETTVQPPVFQNTAHSVYNLNNVADAQKYEVGLVNDQFQRSLNDQSSMVLNGAAKQKSVGKKLIEGLDGNLLSEDEFLTNDQGVRMAPFLVEKAPLLLILMISYVKSTSGGFPK